MKKDPFTLATLALIIALCSYQAKAQTLKDLIISSEVSAEEPKLKALIGPYIGQDISVNLLQKILNEITAFYRHSGHPVSKAFLPEQSSRDGIIQVVVKNSLLEEVALGNHSAASGSTIHRLFSGIYGMQGAPVDGILLNSELLKINDLRVFQLSGAFEESPNNDQVLLSLDVSDAERLRFNLFTDNYGTKAAGRYRTGGLMQINNPLGLADSFSLLFARSNAKQNSFNLNYELPTFSNSTVFGLNSCLSTYELTGEFRELGSKGSSLSLESYLKRNLLRTESLKTDLQGGLRYRLLKDELSVFDVEFKKLSTLAYLELAAEQFDPEVKAYGKLRGSYGYLKNDDDFMLYDDGNFSLINADCELSFKLNPYFALTSASFLQIGSGKLESSELMTIGGADGIACYDSSFIAASTGILSRSSLDFTPFADDKLKLAPCIDAAFLHQAQDASKLFAAGIKLNYRLQGFYADALLSAPLGIKRDADADSLKLWLRLGYSA